MPSPLQTWQPFESLRREVDRLFEDFGGSLWRSPFRSPLFDVAPFRRGGAAYAALPAVDVSETDKAYEITAELPGMDEKNIEVKVANGNLTIKGEKQEEKEEKKKDYYLRERQLRLVRAHLPPAGWHRRRQDRSQFQEGRAYRDAPEKRRRAKARKENHG